MEFSNIFSEFISKEKLGLDISKLKNHVLNYNKNNPNGVVFSNQNGWQSEPHISPFEGNIHLFKKINSFMNAFKDILNLRSNLKLLDYWYNINYKCSFNMSHTHIKSSDNILTGVYYVSVPKNSGNIIFHCANRLRQVSYDFGNVTQYNNYTSSRFIEIPQEDLLILFPSSLEHFVEPNRSEEQRISISFNYGYK